MIVESYSLYRPSDVPWIGEVPTHWEVRRLKNVGSAKIGLTYNPANVVGEGDGTLVLRASNIQNGKLAYDDNVYVNSEIPSQLIMRNGDILLCSRSGSHDLIGKNALVDSAAEGKTFGAFMTVFRSTHNKYAYYVFNSGFFQHHVGAFGTSTVNQLTLEIFLNLKIPLPPLPEQRAIARYLDYMDSRIQRYIGAKERLIELLEEQKRAVINHAVTRGLDPDVPLKSSGVEWLGDVPAHWEVRRLKTMCRMKSGDFIATESIGPAGKYAVYGGNGLRGYTTNYNHDGKFALVGRQGALCGNVHIASGRFWATEHAVVATLQPGHDVSWFGAVLEAMNLNQYSIAAAQPGLAVERIMNLHIPVPNLRDQELIADSLNATLGGISSAAARSHRQIELVKEYRTRLIADVVTGKLDVRDAAANLPDELDDDELVEPSGDLELREAAKIR